MEVRPSVQRLLAGMTAYVRNSRLDIVAANNLCLAHYAGTLSPDALPLNLARFMFPNARSWDSFVEWESLADDLAAALRSESDRHPRGLL
jgi:MmyB-like transcription regulator ligand binding domain